MEIDTYQEAGDLFLNYQSGFNPRTVARNAKRARQAYDAATTLVRRYATRNLDGSFKSRLQGRLGPRGRSSGVVPTNLAPAFESAGMPIVKRRKFAGRRPGKLSRRRNGLRRRTSRGVRKTKGGGVGYKSKRRAYSRKKKSIRRGLKKKSMSDRLVGASVKKIVYRFQNLSPYSAAQGTCTMPGSYLTTTVVGPPSRAVGQYMPCRLYAISSNNNFVNGVLSSPEAEFGLRFVAQGTAGEGVQAIFDTGSANNNCFGAVSVYDGTTNIFRYEVENAPQGTFNSTEDVPHNSNLLNWFEARLKLYGATQADTHWYVDVVQFKQAHFCPEWVQATGTVEEVGQKKIRERSVFWQQLTRPLINSTLSKPLNAGRAASSGIRVLKSIRVLIPSQDNTDRDTGQDERDVKFKMNLNRLQRYDFNPDVLISTITDINAPNLESNNANASLQSNANDVYWTRRLYLMLRCTFSASGDIAANPMGTNNVVTPTYDFCLRKAFSKLG